VPIITCGSGAVATIPDRSAKCGRPSAGLWALVPAYGHYSNRRQRAAGRQSGVRSRRAGRVPRRRQALVLDPGPSRRAGTAPPWVGSRCLSGPASQVAQLTRASCPAGRIGPPRVVLHIVISVISTNAEDKRVREDVVDVVKVNSSAPAGAMAIRPWQGPSRFGPGSGHRDLAPAGAIEDSPAFQRWVVRPPVFDSPSRVAAAEVFGRRLRMNSAPRLSSPKSAPAGA